MAVKRWSRIEVLAETPPIETWPDVNLAGLPERYVETFNARKSAITLYWNGFPLEEVMSQTGISKNLLPRFLKRCLESAPDGRIHGFRALIPYSRTAPYQRVAAETKKLPQAKGGKSGMLGLTLNRFPDLEEDLVALILKKRKTRAFHEHRLSATDLHQIFLKRLKELGVGKCEWPFNTRYQGARSIARYMIDIQDRYFSKSIHVREEQEAQAHVATGKGIAPLISYEHRPYSAVEVDGHRIQAFFSVTFDTPEGTRQRIQLERLWLLVMVDREATAVLAYTVVYSSEITADDVLKLIRKAVSEP